MANSQDRSKGLSGSERNKDQQTHAGGLQGQTESEMGNANRGENAGRFEPYEEGGQLSSESPQELASRERSEAGLGGSSVRGADSASNPIQGSYNPHGSQNLRGGEGGSGAGVSRGDESGRTPDESVGRMTRSGGHEMLDQSEGRSDRGTTGRSGSIPGPGDTGETGSLKGTGTTGSMSGGVRGGRSSDTVGWQGIPDDEGTAGRGTSGRGGSKSGLSGSDSSQDVGNLGSMEREGEIGREGRTGGTGKEKGNLSGRTDRSEDPVEGKRGQFGSGKGDLPEQDLQS